MVSDNVRVKHLLPALLATVVGTDEQKGKEGSEDSAAEIKSSLGDPSEKREEIGDSLICGGVVSLQSKTATTATAVAPQATSADTLGECTTRIEHGLDYGNERCDIIVHITTPARWARSIGSTRGRDCHVFMQAHSSSSACTAVAVYPPQAASNRAIRVIVAFAR